jgi:23S rRNA pseudouridine1911/1915/1917 synthase
MSDKFKVNDSATLLPFLNEKLQGWSRSKIKERLQNGCVSVNGTSIKQHNHLLESGDFVEVSASPKSTSNLSTHLEILYSDHDLIAINKPAGLLSVGNAKESQQHALALLRHQLSHRSRDIKLWPVHRIDRDTSGVLLFATSREMREAVMAKWDAAEKIYYAIVDGTPEPVSGTIDQALRLDEVEYRVHVGEHPDAKTAITHYQTERTANGRSLLKVQLETGRQHQIRAHLAWLGFPVVGDQRYGNAGPRMGLHAHRLSITRPGSRTTIKFEAPAPADFLALMR